MQTFLFENRKKILVVIIIILLFFVIILKGNTQPNNALASTIISEEPENLEEKEIEEIPLFFDIKGEVTNPGVYLFKDGEKVVDAIKEASGLSSKADTSNINLSATLFDEMVIIIPSINEEDECIPGEKIINDALIEPEETNDNTVSKTSLNNASLEELTFLPGIGPSKATAIIDYRTKFLFETIEEIQEVSGIGPATYEKIKNLLTL